jgi:hypothetical protein
MCTKPASLSVVLASLTISTVSDRDPSETLNIGDRHEGEIRDHVGSTTGREPKPSRLREAVSRTGYSGV